MYRLAGFEFLKIWHKRSFITAVFVVVIINIFLIWYMNLPDEDEPELSAYKIFLQETSDMSETEKSEYIDMLKETIDGVDFVYNILTLKNFSNNAGDVAARQEMENNPGIFEKYYELYQSGEYLRFTDSFLKEKTLINELYEEYRKVSEYDNYLQSVQDTKDTLSGISVFRDGKSENFSTRNIQRSAEDYEALTDKNIRWVQQKSVVCSMESMWTDMLLILSVFLYAGNLILEEKEKKLFYITRSTRYGLVHSISAKIISLILHCLLMSVVLYGSNILFFAITTGFGNLTYGIQSLAAYMESSLCLSIWEYMLISIVTKGMAVFVAGIIITTLCIVSDNIFLPYMAGFALYGVSYVMYMTLSPVGVRSVFKYINPAGFLGTENLYGAYLNFDIFGYPVSRLALSWIILVLVVISGIIACIFLFVYEMKFELKMRKGFHMRFHSHTNLFRYESYKILIANKAVFVLIVFGILICYRDIGRSYAPSVQEQYYKGLMLSLEGGLTEDKETLILSEKSRYDEAFWNIDKIDRMVSDGKMEIGAGEALKSQWYAVTNFYASFERVYRQYENIRSNGGAFVYDTGYRYLFGAMNNDLIIDFLLITMGLILSFCNVIVMEYQTGMWNLLCLTCIGRRKILMIKLCICMALSAVLAVLPFAGRIYSISKAFPIRGLLYSANNVFHMQNIIFNMPLICIVFLFAVFQIIIICVITAVVLAVSCWRKNQVQTVFFCILILVVPVVLKLLGII